MRARILALLLVVLGLSAIPVPAAPAAPVLARATSFTVSATLTPTAVHEGELAVLKGRVRPVRRTEKVQVQLLTEDGWETVARRRPDAEGRYRVQVSQAVEGSYVYRARMPRVGRVRAGTSPRRTLTVTVDPVVVFTIPAGTGAGAWNTAETAVEAEVGQTLRIVNADSVAHRLHTDGSAPFPHPDAEVPPSGTADFLLQTEFPLGALYCHNHGAQSQFWIQVTQPAAP